MDREFKNQEGGSIQGLHTLTKCDIRMPGAEKLQDDIEQYAKDEESKIRLMLSKLYHAKADVILGILPVSELERMKNFYSALKRHKHNTLTQMYAELKRISGVYELTVHNIIPTAGRSVIARWIIGDNTYDADTGANYGSLGTSATAVANGDTQLTAESYRKATSSTSQSNNVAILSNFYTATEVTGTFEEAGWHIAGTGSANTGQLLSHFLTGTIVKASTETLTVESTLTIS